MRELKSILITVKVTDGLFGKEVSVGAFYESGGHTWIWQVIEADWLVTLEHKWRIKGKTAQSVIYGFMNKKFDTWNELWPAVKIHLQEQKIEIPEEKCIPDYRVLANRKEKEFVIFDHRKIHSIFQAVLRTREVEAIISKIKEIGSDNATFEVFKKNELCKSEEAIEQVRQEYAQMVGI